MASYVSPTEVIAILPQQNAVTLSSRQQEADLNAFCARSPIESEEIYRTGMRGSGDRLQLTAGG
jgi:hypothetical protein